MRNRYRMLVLAFMCFVTLLGCSRSQQAELDQARTEARAAEEEALAARAELTKAKAEAEALRGGIKEARAELVKAKAEAEAARAAAQTAKRPAPPDVPADKPPPLVLTPGQALDRQFAGLVVFKGATTESFKENGTVFVNLTGEIGVMLKKQGDWEYKIRGADGKPLKLRQAGNVFSPTDDIWIDQAYEILDRDGKVLYQHKPKAP
ncbi:MAG: hypothetical protein C0501_04370 [Isosphaera sp.]|nr:hypothetical protein [Isosphaera sp.]